MKAKQLFPLIAAGLLFVKCECSSTAADLLFSENDKYKIGVDFHKELSIGTKETPAVTFFELEKNKKWDTTGTKYESSADAKIVAQYVDSLGQLLVQQISADEWDNLIPLSSYRGTTITKNNFFQFRVIQDPTINAFAVAGGKVYFYTGILKDMKSEAELIGVLSHEIGHVVKNHTAKRLVKAYGASAILAMLTGSEPGILSQIGMTWFLNNNGQDDELESDAVGVQYSSKIGSNTGVRLYFSKGLEFNTDGSCKGPTSGLEKTLNSFSTHPPACERVTQAKELESKYPASSTNIKSTEYDLGIRRGSTVLKRSVFEDDFKKKFLDPMSRL